QDLGCPLPVDHLDLFIANVFPDNCPVPCPCRGFEDIEFIRVDRTLHDIFAKAVRAGYEYYIPEPGLGVEREDHSARSQVGADHLHDPDREGDLEMVEILVDTVGDRTVGEQGGKTFTAGLPERRVSTDVQVGFLLAGKRSRGEIFCGSRAPDRNIGIGAILFAEPVVGRADLVPDAVRDTGAKNQVPYFFPRSARSATLVLSRPARASLISSRTPPVLTTSQNASAVIANPLGIFTPAFVRSWYISPSEAFLPPTLATSSFLISSNQRIYFAGLIPCSPVDG